MFEKIQQVDFIILNFINEKLSNPFLDKIMPYISLLADNGIIWIAIAVIFLLSKRERKNGFKLSTAILIEFILCNCILKPLVRRVRPYDVNNAFGTLLVSPLDDYSFPSGHTAVSFAAATVLYSINKKWGICAYVLAAAIGFSRLYLYVHFPSDVLAGAIIGILAGMAAVRINKFIFSRTCSNRAA